MVELALARPHRRQSPATAATILPPPIYQRPIEVGQSRPNLLARPHRELGAKRDPGVTARHPTYQRPSEVGQKRSRPALARRHRGAGAALATKISPPARPIRVRYKSKELVRTSGSLLAVRIEPSHCARDLSRCRGISTPETPKRRRPNVGPLIGAVRRSLPPYGLFQTHAAGLRPNGNWSRAVRTWTRVSESCARSATRWLYRPSHKDIRRVQRLVQTVFEP